MLHFVLNLALLLFKVIIIDFAFLWLQSVYLTKNLLLENQSEKIVVPSLKTYPERPMKTITI